MRMFQKDQTLNQIEQYLESLLNQEDETIRYIGDFDLSYEDYKFLIKRLNGLDNFQGEIALLERYKVSILTAWIFGLRYHTDVRYTYGNLVAAFALVPQYLRRQLTSIYANVFEDNNLLKYIYEVKDTKDLCSLIFIHGGIPNVVMEEFLDILYNFHNEFDLEQLENQLFSRLPYQFQEAFHNIDLEVRREIIEVTRATFIDHYINHHTREELLVLHPSASIRTIDFCIQWFKKQSA